MLCRPRQNLDSLLASLDFLVASIALEMCLGVPVTAVAPPQPQLGGEIARLQGRVYGEGGKSLPNARVRLETSEGDSVVEELSDEQGSYNFGGLTRAVYHLSATLDGYETFRQTVDLTRSAFRTIVDIAMTPLNRGTSPSEPPALTDVSAPKKARQEYQKGMRALAAQRLQEAKSHFSKAVESYPCYARAQDAVAMGFVSDHDLASAEAALKKSIACDPGYWSAYLKLGELYNIETRYKESEPLLQEGLRRNPGLSKFHYQLGVAYFGMGVYDKAQEEYLRSESLQPPAPAEVHVKLADVYFRQRSFRKAYDEMKSYLVADPDGRFAGRVKDLISQMDAYRTAHPAAPATTKTASAEP
jgi:Carboxypeptidase regulatory-like domain/Tetratricopeptide repeat